MNCVLQYVTHEVPQLELYVSSGGQGLGHNLTRRSCRENQFRHVWGCVKLIGARKVLRY